MPFTDGPEPCRLFVLARGKPLYFTVLADFVSQGRARYGSVSEPVLVKFERKLGSASVDTTEDFLCLKSTGRFLSSFYEPLILRGAIKFPDRYFVLHVDQTTLSIRKANDLQNKRGRFHKHLRFIEPQKRYFAEMSQLSPGRVKFVPDFKPAISTAKDISRDLAKPEILAQDDADLFHGLIAWLHRNSP